MPDRLAVFVPPHKRGPRLRAAHRKVYQSQAWRQLRVAALQRDQWTCQDCGKELHGGDATVDHIDEMQAGGAALPTLEGVQALCRACNSRKGRANQSGS
jgi:5-methylcytosine-specific restriction endonuclease McrA